MGGWDKRPCQACADGEQGPKNSNYKLQLLQSNLPEDMCNPRGLYLSASGNERTINKIIETYILMFYLRVK